MCGIIAYTGPRQAAPILIEALKSLEYRGYDSAGIAVYEGRSVSVTKVAGRVARLEELLGSGARRGSTGIGHTRWATHGAVNDRNAHPHTSADGSIAIVHNGIVENYLELKKELTDSGVEFRSETDSELIAHLMDRFMKDGDNLETSLRKTAGRIRGAAAIVAISAADRTKVVGLRLGNAGGIVCGFGKGESLLASDLLALLPHTQRIAHLESGEIAIATPGGITFIDMDGKSLTKPSKVVEGDYETAVRGDFPHFMAKEISEQPQAVTACLRQRIDFERRVIRLPEFALSDQQVAGLRQVVLVGMGSSLHAAMTGAHLIEALARIPSRAENASEFRYRAPVIGPDTLVVAVTQSGETADTLAAMEEAVRRDARRIAVTEVDGSQATRMAEGSLLMRAGQEIGVASTKTMTCAMAVLAQLALFLASRRKTITPAQEQAAVADLASLPRLMADTAGLESTCRDLSARLMHKEHLLYLGRGVLYPIALEGALKMKEIAYIHAEGYAAGEMKHGAIALISEKVPTIALATSGPLYEKMLSNINEIKARGGQVIAVATEGDRIISTIADDTLFIPEASEFILPVVAVLPMQLLAYHTAVRLGLDPDKPRNLAKSVTVE